RARRSLAPARPHIAELRLWSLWRFDTSPEVVQDARSRQHRRGVGPRATDLEEDPSHLRTLRKRHNAKANSAVPRPKRARNWGQTMSTPAPRKTIACASMTKYVSGAASMMVCTICGMLSRGVAA